MGAGGQFFMEKIMMPFHPRVLFGSCLLLCGFAGSVGAETCIKGVCAESHVASSKADGPKTIGVKLRWLAPGGIIKDYSYWNVRVPGRGQFEVSRSLNSFAFECRPCSAKPLYSVQACRKLSVDMGSSQCADWVAFSLDAPAPPPPPASSESDFWSGSSMVGVSLNTDRPGSDFTSFQPGSADASSCQTACYADKRCKAWTYLKPNINGSGPNGKCWLKDSAPAPRGDKCCVSGLGGKGLGSKPASAPGKVIKAKGSATAKDDVDIFDGPGGQYNVIGMMRQGEKGVALQHHPDGWCKLALKVPGGAGWVADDHLNKCPSGDD